MFLVVTAQFFKYLLKSNKPGNKMALAEMRNENIIQYFLAMQSHVYHSANRQHSYIYDRVKIHT